jgi:hypothetical protein
MSIAFDETGVMTNAKMEMRACKGCPLHDRSMWPDTEAEEPPDVSCILGKKGNRHRLIYAEEKIKQKDPEYDVFRLQFCTHNRDAWTPPGFRAGTMKHVWFAKLKGFKRTNL